MTESTAEPSGELNSNRHWIETLFPPQFTFQDLLKGTGYYSDNPRISPKEFLPFNPPYDNTESRRQIYITALKEVQQKEAEIKRRNLAKRISREEQRLDTQRPRAGEQHKYSHETLNPDCNGKGRGVDRCIWNAEDISQLRIVLTEIERDRWRLREQLRGSEEQLNSEKETRRRLQDLLEDREGQLELSRKEAARHALAVRALKEEAHSTNIRLQELTRRSTQQAAEAERLRAELRQAKEKYRQVKQERSDLAWELERAQEQATGATGRQAQDARVEYEAAVASLHRRVESAHTALTEERENHGRSRTALELLRRHISKQQISEVQESPAHFVNTVNRS